MDILTHDAAIRNSEITLSLKVKTKSRAYTDIQSDGIPRQVEDTFVFLLLDDSDAATEFIDAWLPDGDEVPELVLKCSYPLFRKFRVCFKRPDYHVRDYHLQVMSKDAEDVLKNMDGKSIVVETVPARNELESEV